MGILSDLFATDRGGWEAVPLSKTQKTADSYLVDLLNRRLRYPTRAIAGLSPQEQQGLDIISTLSQGPTAGYLAGESALRDIVAGRDVATSPEYASFRERSMLEQSEAVSALRRSQQIRGVPPGTPALEQEGQVLRGFAADRTGYLADLLKNELNLRAGAAPTLMQMSTQEPITRAQSLLTAGALPRELSQEQENALFEALVQTLLAPYRDQAPIAQSIMGQQRYAYRQPYVGPYWDIMAGGAGMVARGAMAGA